MDIKSLFNRKKVVQNKKFQENLNKLGEKLANCKTIDEINTLKHDQLVVNITGELEKDRDKESDSKNLLDEFKPAFDAFFKNKMEDDDFKIRCKNLLEACDQLEKAGKQKNISSIAVIKNIDMTGLMSGISRCSNSIMIHMERKNIEKVESDIVNQLISEFNRVNSNSFEKIIEILETLKGKFDGIYKNPEKIEELIECFRKGREKEDFDCVPEIFDCLFAKERAENCKKVFRGMINRIPLPVRMGPKPNDKIFIPVAIPVKKETTASRNAPNLTNQELKQSKDKNNITLQNISKDGNISGGEDGQIDKMIIDIVGKLDGLFGGKIIKDKIVDRSLQQIDKIKDEQQKEIVEKLIKRIKNIRKKNKLKPNSEIKVNKLVEQLENILNMYNNVEIGLDSKGQMTLQTKKDLIDAVNALIVLIGQIGADGKITEEEQESLKEQVEDAIEESPISEKEELKESIAKKIGNISNDGTNFEEIVNEIVDDLTGAVPEKTQKAMKSIVENPLDKAVEQTQNKIDEHNEENNDNNEEDTASKKVINDLEAIVEKVPANGVSFEVARNYTVKMVKVLTDTSIFNDKQIRFIAKKTTAIQKADNLRDLNNEVTQIAAMIRNEGRNQDQKQLEIADKLIDGVNDIAKKVDSTKHMQIESSESVDLKKKQETIKKELEALWVVDKNAVVFTKNQKKSPSKEDLQEATKGKTTGNKSIPPTALEVANMSEDGKISSQKSSYSMGYPYYVLVDDQGNIQHGNTIHLSNKNIDWACINDAWGSGQGDSQVIKLLKNVLKKGRWPNNTNETKQWVAEVL